MQFTRSGLSGASKITTKLTPESPRWTKFVDALKEALGVWGCDGDAEPNVHHHAKRIMATMGDIDIAASLASIKDAGGYCDCEILLNVDPGFWAAAELEHAIRAMFEQEPDREWRDYIQRIAGGEGNDD